MSPQFLYRICGKPVAVAVFLTAAAFSCFGQRSPDTAIRWETDINTAVKRAESEQRPVFLHFTGNDCQPAAQMFAEVFSNAEIAAKLNAGYVMVCINASENPLLAQQYSVAAIPTDLTIRANGQIIHRRQGRIAADQFKNYLVFLDNLAQTEKGTAALPNTPVSTPANTQGTAPAADTLRDPFTHQPVTSAQPGGAYLPVSATPAAETVLTPAAPAAPVLNPPTAAALNPAIHNPLRTAENTAKYFPDQKSPPEPSTSLKVPVNARIADREIMPNEPAPGKMTVEVPLALDGFCPVTLVKEERWEPGIPAYCTMYKGHIFRFASEEAIETFVKDPAAYVPAAMGEDVVLLIDRNKRVNGSRTFGASFNGRVFLFSSRETLEAFSKKAEYYADIALKYETAKKDPPSRTIY
ncbi:MAG: DUF255 domain-containing protein [Planctomycetaceae bacterium]|nr:DUF255 domain-containing protein [Planctomycetaceae bacterium]